MPNEELLGKCLTKEQLINVISIIFQVLQIIPETMFGLLARIIQLQTSSVKEVSAAVYLTNRFHVAVCLFSNRSQMTSKSSVSLMFLQHFDFFCDLFTGQPHGKMESICFIL